MKPGFIRRKKYRPLLLATLPLLLWAGSGSATHEPATPTSNTPTTEAQASVEIPPPVGGPTPPVLEHTAFGIADDASPVGTNDCEGHLQSAAYDLGLGRWLYAYELECHCGPNWDVGYLGAGGGLRVPLNGNVLIPSTLAPDSWHTIDQGTQPYTQDFSNFNAGNDFSTFAGDFTVSASQAPMSSIEFFNADGIFLNGDIAGFITTSPPQLQTGVFLGGSNTRFTLVVPQAAGPGRVTGGGFVAVGNTKASFGFNAVSGSNPTVPPRGQLEFHNKATGDNVHSDTIADVEVSGNTATFSGTCTNNPAVGPSVPCTFRVIVQDNGEGNNAPAPDSFTISGLGFTGASGPVEGGNIQVH